MRLLITGDLVVNRPYNASKMLDQEIVKLFNQSDYNIVNLEAPVTDSEKKTLKTGPNLKVERNSTLGVLKELRIDAVTLANNHVLDYGSQGVADTLQFCEANNIATVGAGMNIAEASKTLFINSEEGRIAIVNFAENEWSAATSDSAGFNPMNLIDNTCQIQDARKQANYVIVIIHGGHEYYNLPSPRMQKQYRFHAEQGADVVVGHHTHCISGHEVHGGTPIYYSLGNFLFTGTSNNEERYLGMILEIEIKNKRLLVNHHFVKSQKESFGLYLFNNHNTAKRVNQFNRIIEDNKKLEENWNTYIKEKKESYLNYWSPLSFIRSRRLHKVLNKLGLRLYNKKGFALYLNLMRCESHGDLSKEVIKDYLNNSNS